uniref:Uncharacterized protein n=1 Tax=Rhizophora mucronata TaxID=61149 RepID=A0A2P2NJQ6_RHIMU
MISFILITLCTSCGPYNMKGAAMHIPMCIIINLSH